MLNNILKITALFILLFTSMCAHADNALATEFVKSFYLDLQKAEADTSLGRTQKLKNYFDPALYQLLSTDDDNRAKNKEHMCGFVGFDVFGNFREDADAHVKTDIVNANTGTTQVAVTLPGTELPALTMALKNENGKWKIINIIYPTDTIGPEGIAGKLKQLQKINCPKETEPTE